MKTYHAVIGVFVRTYAKFEVEAESNEKAVEAAIAKFKSDSEHIVYEDTDYENLAQPSIASLYAEDGEDVACGHDFALNLQDSLEAAAGDLLKALELVVSWAGRHNLDKAETITGHLAEVPVIATARAAIAKAKGEA